MDLINHIEPAAYYAFLSLIFGLFTLNKSKQINSYLLLILFVCFLNEIISSILEYKGLFFDIVYSVTAALHNCLWLLIISFFALKRKGAIIFILVYLFFCIINLLFIEGLGKFNFNIFILGAFIYISFFIYESFHQLKKENFTFFKSNDYILLFSPVLLFFGLSFVFGFKSQKLAETVVFDKIMLYDFIVYFVNIVYYTLINIYIYREKKLKHA